MNAVNENASAIIPVLDSENMTALEIDINIAIVKNLLNPLVFRCRISTTGNPIDNTAANPAGLSKEPVNVKLE